MLQILVRFYRKKGTRGFISCPKPHSCWMAGSGQGLAHLSLEVVVSSITPYGCHLRVRGPWRWGIQEKDEVELILHWFWVDFDMEFDHQLVKLNSETQSKTIRRTLLLLILNKYCASWLGCVVEWEAIWLLLFLPVWPLCWHKKLWLVAEQSHICGKGQRGLCSDSWHHLWLW